MPVGRASAISASLDPIEEAHAPPMPTPSTTFELDTTGIPVATLARELLDWYRSCPHPEVFDRLRKRFLT